MIQDSGQVVLNPASLLLNPSLPTVGRLTFAISRLVGLHYWYYK